MTTRSLATLFTGGSFFEGPRWHDGTWWVSDFYRQQVSRIGTDGTEEVVASVEHQPSGMGWLADGSMVVVSMTDHRLLRVADGGEVVALARVRGGAVREVDGVRRVECDRAVVRFDRGVKVLRGHLRVARLLRLLGLRLVLGRGAHG